ncbi:hypothetical protein [Cellulomonas hominis]
MNRRAAFTRLAATAVAAATAVIGAGAAYADPSTPSSNAEVITTPMVVTGFDSKVAAANGYQIVTRADGTQASVATGPSVSPLADVTPATTVGGTCGTSSVVLLDAGGGKAAVSTGWTTIRGAISYSWSVTVAGSAGTYTKNFGGGLLNRSSWTGSFTWTVPRTGYYIAGVSPSSSVVLNNGSVCSSLAPTDGETIYR